MRGAGVAAQPAAGGLKIAARDRRRGRNGAFPSARSPPPVSLDSAVSLHILNIFEHFFPLLSIIVVKGSSRLKSSALCFHLLCTQPVKTACLK